MTWNPTHWLTNFRARGADFRRLRADVFQDTAKIVRAREYRLDDTTIPLDDHGQYDALYAGTRLYEAADDLEIDSAELGAHDTQVSVINADCLEVAELLSGAGLNPVVLNMANRRNPGGGVLGGAGAQEENLFRRSNLLWSMYQFVDYCDQYAVPRKDGASYPLQPESGAVYSPGVQVFRSSEATGYGYLSKPYRVSVVSIPAIPNPPTEVRDGREWLTPAIAEATRVKIRAILKIGSHHGHDALVLSALGCGAFRNPPHHVADLFRDVLTDPQLRGLFKVVTFAILDDHNAHQSHNPEGNLLPFHRALG